jgi:DNA-binding NtrC family response regulator
MQQSILVVAQDQNALEVLRDHLEQGGWHVTMAHSIQTALQAMEGNHFDVLLSWVSLGPSSGLALLGWLNDAKANCLYSLPFLMRC